MPNAYELNNYSVVVSLNERTIYIKVTDTVNYITYEGNPEIKELRLNTELADAYAIVTKCLRNDDDYCLKISVNTGILKLNFNALVGGFLKMNFEILLREKVMSNDGQLTLNFNRLEQQLSVGLKQLLDRCNSLEQSIEDKNEALIDLTNKLSFANIIIGYSTDNGNDNHSVKQRHIKNMCDEYLDIQQININNSSQHTLDLINTDVFKYFYKLKKLTYTGGFDSTNLKEIENNSVEELIINNAPGPKMCIQLTSLQGLEQMPNLQKIEIVSASKLTDIPTVLSSYNHKITNIKIKDCPNVNVVELQTYCQANNINLEVM
jgi:hypothetical protein